MKWLSSPDIIFIFHICKLKNLHTFHHIYWSTSSLFIPPHPPIQYIYTISPTILFFFNSISCYTIHIIIIIKDLSYHSNWKYWSYKPKVSSEKRILARKQERRDKFKRKLNIVKLNLVKFAKTTKISTKIISKTIKDWYKTTDLYIPD